MDHINTIEILKRLNNLSSTAYVKMVTQSEKTECLGRKFKLKNGIFSERELEAHELRAELYGMYQAFIEASEIVNGEL